MSNVYKVVAVSFVINVIFQLARHPYVSYGGKGRYFVRDATESVLPVNADPDKVTFATNEKLRSSRRIMEGEASQPGVWACLGPLELESVLEIVVVGKDFKQPAFIQTGCNQGNLPESLRNVKGRGFQQPLKNGGQCLPLTSHAFKGASGGCNIVYG